jgi:hypothetical protein
VIGLRNVGVVAATNLSATLTTSTSDISITLPDSSAYPNLAAISGAGTNAGPLLFTVGSRAACPTAPAFALNVTYDGGSQSLPFSLTLGTRTININSTLDGIAPASTPFFTGATGTQVGRINRLTPVSSCGTTKPFPGLQSTTGNRPFDAYTFNSCGTSAPSCVTVTMANNSISAATPNPQLFDVAYIPSFNPANLSLGYAGDPASSNLTSAPNSFSFSLPGGGTPFAVAVHEVNPGTATGANYSLSVSGGCFGNCSAPNNVPVAKAKSVTVSASPVTCGAAASVDDGSFDPDGDALTITQSPAGPYAIGTTSVLLTVVDPRGATSQATGSVTVVDDTPPSITCPGADHGRGSAGDVQRRRELHAHGVGHVFAAHVDPLDAGVRIDLRGRDDDRHVDGEGRRAELRGLLVPGHGARR